jgi:hypothetical protein
MKERYMGHTRARGGKVEMGIYVARLRQHLASVNAEFLLCREFESWWL